MTKITVNYTVDVKDIQPKHVRSESNPQNQNKIRRAWVLSLSDNAMEVIQNKIKSAPARHAYYEAIDREVSNKWIELMRKHTTESINAGAKFIMTSCGERLEDDYCGNADERLIVAAQIVAETIAADFNR
uniref:RNA polymerase binding n=1 Tax=Escherichia phage 121/2022-2B TaxID=3103121 RepID=A0AAU6NUN4_9VIRU